MEDVRYKKKPTKLQDMSKEQIRRAILKKRECNAQAQQVVEKLLDKYITEEFFLECLPNINQSHFEDIIEERSIIEVCGYPLCQNPLIAKDIPKQTYRISLKTNKVYNITTRKSFCSNKCYKSAMHIKQQLLTSPLWFREYEEIPKFELLSSNSIGSLGQEVDVTLVEHITADSRFSSINDFTSSALNEIDTNKNFNTHDSDKSLKTVITNININSSNNTSCKKINVDDEDAVMPHVSSCVSVKLPMQEKDKSKNLHSPLNIVGEVKEKSVKTMHSVLEAKPIKSCDMGSDKQNPKILIKEKQPSLNSFIIEVEKCVAEWFTIDTLLLLFGVDMLREMLADKGECIKEYINNYGRSTLYNSNNYDQYLTLCKKLNMLELEDRRFDAVTLHKETKPLPDYSVLKEHSKEMQLKVKAYLSGVTEIVDYETFEHKLTESNTEDEGQFTQLPLVDNNAQNALRRRIVYEQLNKVLPDILKSLGLLSLSISSDVRLLINTFKLKANNIMFKPMQWTIIAIIVIKLLSLRDKKLECLLEQPKAFNHLQLLLLSYKQDGGYLDRLISWLTDIDRLLDTNDTQLTLG